MFTKRLAWVVIAALCLGTQSEARRLRVVAANLSSGAKQSYDGGHGIRIVRALNADVVLLQEFNYRDNSVEAQKDLAKQMLGGEPYFYREAVQGLPNGIISRFPILESGSWDDADMPNREFAHARIDLPGKNDLYAVSVHLKAGKAAPRRAGEARQLVNYIKRDVPVGGLLVVGGDFNTSSITEQCLGVLGEVCTTSGPLPMDEAGDHDTNANRSKPYDWVLVSPALHGLGRPVVVGQRSFPGGLVVDTRVYEPLSDLPGAQKTDSAAPSMQHMAVVRDFEIP